MLDSLPECSSREPLDPSGTRASSDFDEASPGAPLHLWPPAATAQSARRRRHQTALAACIGIAIGVASMTGWEAVRARWPSSSHLRGMVDSEEVQSAKDEEEDICGTVEDHTEFHTTESLYWVSNIASQELCCAECDAVPSCSAWTYGTADAVEGAARHCFLKKLADGEQPTKFNRTGLVSGLILKKRKKHGVVSKMLIQEGSSRDVATIQENETCPGQIFVKGYGNVSVIAAMWRNPNDPGGLVEVPYRNWALIPHLRGRAYFGDACSVATTGHYVRKDYAAMRLLGNTLRYTVDLSKAGCGCNAQLHLAPLQQNAEASKCKDYFCGHGFQHCGVSCTEIGIQDANQYAWSSNLHLHDDSAGPAAGYGGGSSGWSGRREWSEEDYGPDGKCIDTTWPFDVEVSFPTWGSGLLKAVEVTLTQEGHSCSLKATLDKYHFKGRNGMVELTSILNRGVTPVVQYWGSPDLQWLDGAGRDGEGPCVREVPKVCPDSVRFYDFSVEQGAKGHKVRQPEEGLLVSAIDLLHEHSKQSAGEAVNKAVERLETEEEEKKIDKLPDAISDQISPVVEGDGNQSVPVHIQPVPSTGDFLEWEDGNQEWEVMSDLLYLRNSSSFTADVLSTKLKGEVIIGKQLGSWIKVPSENGYAPIKVSNESLRKRVVAYEKIVKGSCTDAGMFAIEDMQICAAAGFALGYFDSGVQIKATSRDSPQGCYLHQGELFLSVSKANGGKGVVGKMEPVCASKAYPTTTTTTTTITSTTTSTTTVSSTTTTTHTTITTTSTTTWGYPSLFCVEVVRVKGYELPLVKAQQSMGASIFGCEEYAVFSDGGKPRLVGIGPDGKEIKTIVIPPIKEAIGDLNNGATTNSWLNTETFLQVWDLVKKDGRYRHHNWIVKVDPDAVFFPDRLRNRMRPHTVNMENAKLFVMNCARYNPVALYGSMEIFSREGLEEYLRGQWNCRKNLPWHGWGEDFFMSHCMDMLRVGRIYDFDLLADKRCVYRPCSDQTRVAFHDYKDSSLSGSWFQCWNESRRR